MGKKIRFSFDLVISDEKKEVAVKESENTEIVFQNTGNVILPSSARRTKRKKLFTMGLVMVSILLLGLGAFGIVRQGNTDKDIKEPPEIEVQEPQVQEPQVQEPQVQEPQVQEPQVQEPQVQEPVRILAATDPELRKSGMVEYSDLVDGESRPCADLNDKLNFFPTNPETRSIMESGYYYEMYDEVEDGIFTLEFVAATGYADDPRLLLNIYVDDEEIVAQNDKIQVFAYCLDQETYDKEMNDNSIEGYGQWNAYGVQDKNDPHLYRVTLPSGSFLAGGNQVVFDMTTIRFGTRDTEWKEYQVNLKEMIKVPYHIAFYPTLGISTDGLEFKSDTKTYKLYWTHIAHDLTDLVFFYDFDTVYYDEKVVGNDGVQFGRFIKEVILEIDGVEYKVNPDAIPYINMTDDKDNVQYYVYAEFPGVKDVVGIKEVIVKYRDIEYRLR